MSEPGFASLGPTLLARKGGAKPAMRPQLAPLVAPEAENAPLADEQLEDLGWNDMGDGTDPESAEAGADVVPINAAAAAAADTATAASPIVRRQQRRLEERVLADAVMTGPDDEADETADSFDAVAEEADEEDAFDHEAWTANDADEEDYEEGYEPSYGDDFEAGDFAPLVAAPVAVPAPVVAKPRRAPRSRAKARAVLAQPERRAAFTLRLDPERHLKLRLAATMQNVSAQALLTEALDAMLAEFDDLDVIAAHLKRH